MTVAIIHRPIDRDLQVRLEVQLDKADYGGFVPKSVRPSGRDR